MREIIDLILGIFHFIISIVPPFIVWKVKNEDIKAGALFIFLVAVISNSIFGFAYIFFETLDLLI